MAANNAIALIRASKQRDPAFYAEVSAEMYDRSEFAYERGSRKAASYYFAAADIAETRAAQCLGFDLSAFISSTSKHGGESQ